jgi:hypothetical protein
LLYHCLVSVWVLDVFITFCRPRYAWNICMKYMRWALSNQQCSSSVLKWFIWYMFTKVILLPQA